MKKTTIGHLAAFFTVSIWGTTFISTKVLLQYALPVEILVYRFVLGLIALYLVRPKPLPKTNLRQEVTFAAAGLCGVCLYYLLENIALTYTMASNVGVVLSAAPFFTAILSYILSKKQAPLHTMFFVGFVMAILGISLISFNGARLELNPLGDILAVLAAFVWACYSHLTKKIGEFGYPVILTTRRIFIYGLVFMIPALYLFDASFQPALFVKPVFLLNILFLGLGASACCFVTWNFAVETLGPVRTSIYVYVGPVITLIASSLILHEKITPLAWMGTALILVSLVISDKKRAS